MSTSFIPVPFPDETALGVMLRAARLCGYKNFREFVQAASPKLEIPIGGSTQAQFNLLIRWFCFVGDGLPGEVIARFTNLPAYIPFASADLEIELVTGPWREVGLDRSAERRISPLGARFGAMNHCPACNREHMDEYGSTTWSRAHQLPGVVVCWKHGCDLILRKFKKTTIDLPSPTDTQVTFERQDSKQQIYALSIKEITEENLPWLPPDARATLYRRQLARVENGDADCRDFSDLMLLLAEDSAGTLLLPGLRMVSSSPEKNARLVRLLFPDMANFAAAFRAEAVAQRGSSANSLRGIKFVDELKHREAVSGFATSAKSLFRLGPQVIL
jgi:hypothetical protein